MVKPGDLRLATNTTLSMEPDLRMKLTAAKAERTRTKVSPEDFQGPDTIDDVKAKALGPSGMDSHAAPRSARALMREDTK